MANPSSSAVFGAVVVGGSSGPGAPYPLPMEVDGDKGSGTTLGKAGPSG